MGERFIPTDGATAQLCGQFYAVADGITINRDQYEPDPFKDMRDEFAKWFSALQDSGGEQPNYVLVGLWVALPCAVGGIW